ncbi:FGGY family carbohydrate kinase [Acuticoccus sp. MNP-M23]|uniref:FGGY family carbohydrate kinase n=1 Tax=Acuticoccus sp. MNP-M23 TaxID=3072793 RepID=UPI0028163716|nr:FGGY family carbohydrate kinase [Acuticoccus sp. MNP-M23]WMS44713.1 FGGY family carbohydrate kinase [Acuticoccus sp. MNP-M23]
MSILAIDQGTTSTRAILVAADGTARTLHAATHKQHYPGPGHVEHDPRVLLTNVRAGLDAAASVPDLDAVGLANQGESCLAWNRHTGEPITPVIVWQDDRTRGDIKRLRQEGHEPQARERTGLPLDPYFSASKLGWILREIPEAARLAGSGALSLGTTDAFFRQHLTGRCETDVTTASRTGLMNLASLTWDAELCALYGVPADALPPIGPSAGPLGTVRVGSRDKPLAASLVDQQAALYGHGCTNPGDAKITCGTGAFMLCVTGSEPPAGSKGALPTVLWQRAGQAPRYGLDGAVYSAAAAVNWAQGLGLFKSFDEIERFDAPPAIGRGLAFVPALSGLACPRWDRSARGAFLGLSLDTTPRDMMQAVLEGIALRLAEVAAAIDAEQTLADTLPLDGGLSVNPYFTRFLADCTGRTLRIADIPDVTAIGTARLAAEAVSVRCAVPGNGRLVHPQPLGFDAASRFRTAVEAAVHFAAAMDADAN